MRAAWIGRLLLALGLVVGATAGVGLLLGFEPARLPRDLLNIAAYKLTFLAAGGLLAAGALALRYARQGTARTARSAVSEPETPALAEGLSRDASFDETLGQRQAPAMGADRDDR